MNSYDLRKIIEAIKKETALNILDLLNKYDYDLAIEVIKKTYLTESKENLNNEK